MKGKKYHIDKTTGKLVEMRPENEIPEFKTTGVAGGTGGMPDFKTETTGGTGGMEDFIRDMKANVRAVGMVSIPTPRTQEEEHRNLSRIFDAADREAESLDDRRDTLRVQETIQRMRESFLDK
jgi:hypothetical protein